jgi:putative inorganic carbon (HCO3(-)) transporter
MDLKRFGKHLLTVEIFLFSAFVAGSLVTQRLFPWTILVGIVFMGIRWGIRGRMTVPTPVDMGVLGLLLMIPISLAVTPLPEQTRTQAMRLVISILFFYAIVNWAQTQDRLRLAVLGVILAGAGISLFALVSVEWQTQKLYFLPSFIYDRFSILVKDTSHSNVMGGNVALLLLFGPLLLLFAWRELALWRKMAYGVVFLFTAGVLILTQSRGALIGVMAVIPLVVTLRWRRGWIILPTLSLILGGAIAHWGLAEILDWASANVKVGGIQGRIEIWSRGVSMIRDFPLTGIGMGTFPDVAEVLYPFESFPDWRVPHVHNLVLQVGVDVGVPGLIAWGAILLGVSYASFRVYLHGRQQSDAWISGLGCALLSSQAVLLIHGIVDDVTWGVRPEPILWGIWGVAIAAFRLYIDPQDDLFLPENEKGTLDD